MQMASSVLDHYLTLGNSDKLLWFYRTVLFYGSVNSFIWKLVNQLS
jgi:hypothetical protein